MFNKTLWKRIGLVTLFIFIAIGIGFLLYVLFFRELVGPGPTNQNTNNQPSGTLPATNVNINAGVITVNVNGTVSVILPSIDTFARGGNTLVDQLSADIPAYANVTAAGLVYYEKSTGEFYKFDDKGNKVLLTDQKYADAQNIVWNPNGQQAILEFPDGSNVMYDFNRKIQNTLPKELTDFSFNSNGSQIAFKFLADDQQDRWLGVSAPDGTGAKGLELLGSNDSKVNVDWSPSGQTVALMRESVGIDDNEITFIGLNGENFKGTIVKGRGFESQWSPEGKQLLYSVYSENSDYNPELWVVDSYGEDIGKNRINIGLQTWSDKCTFGGTSTIYCGVPQQLDYGTGIVPAIADSIPDVIYKVDLKTGSKSIIANPVNSNGENVYTVDKIYTSPDGKYLYFTDKKTGKLQRIIL